MSPVPEGKLWEAGCWDPLSESMATLCRDIIRSLGAGFKGNVLRIPSRPGISLAMREYAEAISETLGVELPDNETKGSYGAFVDAHRDAFKMKVDEANRTIRAEAREKAALARAEKVRSRLAAGLPAREPPDPLGNVGKKWTDAHVKRLLKLWEAKAAIPVIAGKLRRTEGAVVGRLQSLGLVTPEEAQSLRQA